MFVNLLHIFVSDKTERLRVQIIRSKFFVDYLIQDYKRSLAIEAYKQIGEHEDAEKDVSYRHGNRDGFINGKATGEREKELEWERKLPIKIEEALEAYKAEQAKLAAEAKAAKKKWM